MPISLFIAARENGKEIGRALGASLWVGGLIGLLVLILTVCYNKQFSYDARVSLVLTIITAGIAYVIFGIYGSWFMNKRSNEFLTSVDELFAKVERGESLPSLMELKKKT